MVKYNLYAWGSPKLAAAARRFAADNPDLMSNYADALTSIPKAGRVMLGGDNWPLIRARFEVIKEKRPDLTVGIMEAGNPNILTLRPLKK
jgi:hypothetical protein